MRAEILHAVLVCVVVAVCGVLLGLLWSWLAPRVPLVSNSEAVYLKDTEGEQAIGGDGTFALLGLAFGVVSAAVVFLLRRSGGVPLVVALAVGGVLGSLLAWRVGIWLGPAQDVVTHAKEVGKGVTFDAPLELSAKGVLLAWPVAAMVVLLALTALFGPREPDPYAEGFGHYPEPQQYPGPPVADTRQLPAEGQQPPADGQQPPADAQRNSDAQRPPATGGGTGSSQA